MIKKVTEGFQKFRHDKSSRNRFLIFILMMFLILYSAIYAAPKISLIIGIGIVTDKDYDLFLQNNDGIPSEMKTRENCRLFTYDFKMNKPVLFVRNVQISKDSLSRYLDDKLYFDSTADKFHGLGLYSATDNHYHFIEAIDVYSEGITDEMVYRFFEDYRIEVSWVDLFNRKHKAYYYLKDYYEN